MGNNDMRSDMTTLLKEVTKGNQEAVAELIPLVYHEMRRLAGGYMRRERENHTLQATALVHEAYLRLVQQRSDWRDRAHFFGVAAQVMRRILIDHARGHLRIKHGGQKEAIPLDEALVFSEAKSEELLAVNEALDRLAKLDPRQSKIVEMRFFGGLTVEETAEAMGISPMTVKRDWNVARAWLYGELERKGYHARNLGKS
jgi:RNA polymerase sigma-70 factor (ECF subfamily)